MACAIQVDVLQSQVAVLFGVSPTDLQSKFTGRHGWQLSIQTIWKTLHTVNLRSRRDGRRPAMTAVHHQVYPVSATCALESEHLEENYAQQWFQGGEVWRRCGKWSNCFWRRQCDGVGQHLPHWINKACHHRRQSECREISRWGSATSGDGIFPQSGTKLMTVLASEEHGYQRLPPEFGSGDDRKDCLKPWPNTYWTRMGSAWACCSFQNHQHTHNGCFVTNACWSMKCEPTALCDQPVNQHVEVVTGCCGCTWLSCYWAPPFDKLMNY